MTKIAGDFYLTEISDLKSISSEDLIINLEFPIIKKASPVSNKITLGNQDSFLESFRTFPYGVTLANNHILDHGKKGLLSTIDYLEANNIKYCGVGTPKNNFNNPLVTAENFHIHNYCCESTNLVSFDHGIGVSLIDEVKIISDIQKSKITKSRGVIIVLHWGEEEIKYPKDEDVKLARKLIDSGADIVIGHHSHVIQSQELYKNRKIFYGIGNLAFDDIYSDSKLRKNLIKRQLNTNKSSLLINISEDLEINYESLYYKNRMLSKIRNETEITVPRKGKFQKALKYHIRKIKLFNFIKAPHKLSLKKLRKF